LNESIIAYLGLKELKDLDVERLRRRLDIGLNLERPTLRKLYLIIQDEEPKKFFAQFLQAAADVKSSRFTDIFSSTFSSKSNPRSNEIVSKTKRRLTLNKSDPLKGRRTVYKIGGYRISKRNMMIVGMLIFAVLIGTFVTAYVVISNASKVGDYSNSLLTTSPAISATIVSSYTLENHALTSSSISSVSCTTAMATNSTSVSMNTKNTTYSTSTLKNFILTTTKTASLTTTSVTVTTSSVAVISVSIAMAPR
jgi:hypothetical protein